MHDQSTRTDAPAANVVAERHAAPCVNATVRADAEQRLVAAHTAHNAARAQLATQHAATARAQADECEASADVESAKNNPASARTLRAVADGCRQRACEWDHQARSIVVSNSPPPQSPERDA